MTGGGSWMTLDSCEISWNNIANYRRLAPTSTCPGDGGVADGPCGGYWGAGGTKFVLALGTSMADPGLLVDNLNTHDNVGPGFWEDVHNQYVRFTGGQYHDNEGDGLFYEISCYGEITAGTFEGNGRTIKNKDLGAAAGIRISDSNGCLVHGNTVYGGPEAIAMIYPTHANMLALKPANQCPPAATDTDITQSLENNTVANNSIYMCAGQTAGLSEISAPVTLSQRNDVYTGNKYGVASTTGSYWDDGTTEAWAAWQASGEDTDGGVKEGCTP